MRTWEGRTLLLAILGLGLTASPVDAQTPLPGLPEAQEGSDPTRGEVRNLILVIADGAGIGHWSAARLARGEDLAVASMPVIGLLDTRNVDGGITDSAAGATALATGERSYDGAIAVGVDCREVLAADPEAVRDDPASCAPLETLLFDAQARGMSTGLVTTTRITDATPAAFVAQVPRRTMQPEIARQMLASGVDVLLGGGRRYFDGSREGAPDLLAEACVDADCPATAEELEALDGSERRLVGLFAPGEMPPAGERDPDLPTLTRVALDRLSRNPDGFFLMVEEEGTDSYAHANVPLDAITAEVVQVDRAVEIVLDFARRTPGTLVVVTSDHETGGLTLREEEGRPVARYTTGGHTGVLVPLFAYGPGAERLGGMLENSEVGRLLREMLRGEEGESTDGLRRHPAPRD